MRMKPNERNCTLENFSADAVAKVADMLRMLSHPMRLRIVDLLNSAGMLPVCSITDYLGIAQAATSQHLNQMRRAGLIRSERRGKEVWYSIVDRRPIALLNCMCNVEERNE